MGMGMNSTGLQLQNFSECYLANGKCYHGSYVASHSLFYSFLNLSLNFFFFVDVYESLVARHHTGAPVDTGVLSVMQARCFLKTLCCFRVDGESECS